MPAVVADNPPDWGAAPRRPDFAFPLDSDSPFCCVVFPVPLPYMLFDNLPWLGIFIAVAMLFGLLPLFFYFHCVSALIRLNFAFFAFFQLLFRNFSANFSQIFSKLQFSCYRYFLYFTPQRCVKINDLPRLF